MPPRVARDGVEMNTASNNDDRQRALQEATEWFVRLNNPLVSDETRRAYQIWLGADATHPEAMHDVSELWGALDQPAAQLAASGWHRDTPAPIPTPRPRRPAKIGVKFAAASAVLALVAAILMWRDPGIIDRAFADAATRPGERRDVRLADGSLAVLDGDTALNSDMAGGRRVVTLLRGRAWFDVVADSARPFTVHAGQVDVQVRGTAFEVDRDAAAVTVEHGRVAVSGPPTTDLEVDLTDWQRVALQNGRLGTPTAIEPDQAFAWRRGLIIVDRAPLSQVVKELDKMAPGHVLIVDRQLERTTLSGTFRADDQETVLEALRATLGVRTLSVPGVATLIYR